MLLPNDRFSAGDTIEEETPDCIATDRAHAHPEIGYIQRQKGMKILSWNIRSLVKNFDEISALFDNTEIDIINFNETWLGKDNINSHVRLQGYKIYRLDRYGKKREEVYVPI